MLFVILSQGLLFVAVTLGWLFWVVCGPVAGVVVLGYLCLCRWGGCFGLFVVQSLGWLFFDVILGYLLFCPWSGIDDRIRTLFIVWATLGAGLMAGLMAG